MTSVGMHTVPRVRFFDDESRKEGDEGADEVDRAAPIRPERIKHVHFSKLRSSSETSLLLRMPLGKSTRAYRRSSLDMKNNNCLGQKNENFTERFNTFKSLTTNDIDNRLHEKTEENDIEQTKDAEIKTFKKNLNVYSVNQATITMERRRSLPLPNIPKLISLPSKERNGRKHSIVPVCVDSVEEGLELDRDLTTRTLGRISRGLGRLLRRSNSVKISEPDHVYKVAYLGNVLTGWARGENCVEKPLATLWKNYNQSNKPDVVMKLSITNSGLKGFTKEHGLTEYWSHRITFCASLPHYPKIFCWVYRHEGRKLKQELRCHAVLCAKASIAVKVAQELKLKLHQALTEFKKEKLSKQNARLSLANSVYENPSMPRRKILLSVGAVNYKPPLERSKSAPKLGAIEELCSEEDEEEAELNNRDNFDTWSTKTLEDINENNEFNFEESIEGDIYTDDIDRNVTSCKDILDLLVKQSINDDHVLCPAKSDCLQRYENHSPTTPTLVIDCKNEDSHSRVPSNVHDSDDGSVSSGCETASTVTSSDVEPTSLPCHLTMKDSNVEYEDSSQISVFERVRSFEQIFGNNNNDVCVNFKSRHRYSSCGSQDDSCFGGDVRNCDSDSQTYSEEVNSIPIGETQSFRRRCTYPPLKTLDGSLDSSNEDFRNLLDIYGSLESEKNCIMYKSNCDNESACSDESGYSEFSENCKESVIGNTIVV